MCPAILFMENVVNGDNIAMAVIMAIALLADVVPLLCGRCCCCHHCVSVVCGRWKATMTGIITTCLEQVAGVFANMADEIAT